ncbi:MAG: K(+)-transporting ATPase subunit F [Polyangiaceae bacterium]
MRSPRPWIGPETMLLLAAALAALTFGYLLVAIIRPEKF